MPKFFIISCGQSNEGLFLPLNYNFTTIICLVSNSFQIHKPQHEERISVVWTTQSHLELLNKKQIGFFPSQTSYACSDLMTSLRRLFELAPGVRSGNKLLIKYSNSHQWKSATRTFNFRKVLVKFRIFLRMPFHVQCQVIWPWKASITVDAFKRFSSCVLTIVSSKFIRACEPPITTFPWTFIRFLPCVCPLMRLEMWTFSINFPTTAKMAFMNASFAFRRVFRAGSTICLSERLVVSLCARRACCRSRSSLLTCKSCRYWSRRFWRARRS